MTQNEHVHDSQCTVDPETLCCTVCGVYHSAAQCTGCGQRAFHLPACTMDLEWKYCTLEEQAEFRAAVDRVNNERAPE